jgi:hypothetical protein
MFPTVTRAIDISLTEGERSRENCKNETGEGSLGSHEIATKTKNSIDKHIDPSPRIRLNSLMIVPFTGHYHEKFLRLSVTNKKEKPFYRLLQRVPTCPA